MLSFEPCLRWKDKLPLEKKKKKKGKGKRKKKRKKERKEKNDVPTTVVKRTSTTMSSRGKKKREKRTGKNMRKRNKRTARKMIRAICNQITMYLSIERNPLPSLPPCPFLIPPHQSSCGTEGTPNPPPKIPHSMPEEGKGSARDITKEKAKTGK